MVYPQSGTGANFSINHRSLCLALIHLS